MSRPLDKALSELERAARHVREALASGEHDPSGVQGARQLLSVLAELEKRGGRVSRSEFLRIGERYGYKRRGMAGFYQQLVSSERGDTALTELGRKRLEHLRTTYELLVPLDLASTVVADSDPFIAHLLSARQGSGSTYDAEDAKRAMYRS